MERVKLHKVKEFIMRLYHYTTIDKFKSIWEKNELWFSSSHTPSNNDYFERVKGFSISGDCIEFFDKIMDRSSSYKTPNYFHLVNSYKQISFCMDYSDGTLGCLSPMMWGQYGDKGKGVCIEFNSEKWNFSSPLLYAQPIQYQTMQDEVQLKSFDFKDSHTLYSAIERQINIIFFQKHSHWSFENEYRVISREVHHLTVFDAVSHIYVLGYDSNTSRSIREIVKNDTLLSYVAKCTNGTKKMFQCIPFPRKSAQ